MWNRSDVLSNESIIKHRKSYPSRHIQPVSEFPASYKNKWSDALTIEPNKMQVHALKVIETEGL